MRALFPAALLWLPPLSLLGQSLPASTPTSAPASTPVNTPISQPTGPTQALPFTLLDPTGDDDGPGTYKYPTASVYTKGAFDLTQLKVTPDGDNVIFEVTYASKVDDPWNSTSWGGWGFSLQMLQIYIDQDNTKGSGVEDALPGMNAKFFEENYWDKVILLTAQPNSKTKSEVATKAKEVADRVVYPREVSVRGKSIIITVSRADLGEPKSTWGYQVLSSSTEGFPDKAEVFTRGVNQAAGEHRFGGGDDSSADPNFVDIFMPPAKGDAKESDLQHQYLSDWKIGLDFIPMVYPADLDAIPPKKKEGGTSSQPAVAAKLPFKLESQIFTKWLYQNDQSQGTVSLGNPNVEGDNFSGNNGIGSELGISLTGQVSPEVEAGARIQSRFGQQWADFYENGDLAVDENGVPTGVDSTGESLGQNHAAYLQLRGVYVRVAPPIKNVTSVLVGSSDLSMFNPWTIGKIRYIDRFNAKGVFAQGTLGEGNEWVLARVALPKLFASAGFNTGIDDPLIANPFFARDAAYAAKFKKSADAGWFEWIGSLVLDEEADVNDPDALGSTNVIDEKDGVVSTLPRYINLNTTAELQRDLGVHTLNLIGGFSYSSPWLCSEKADRFEDGQECKDLVFNSVEGAQGFSPIVMQSIPGYFLKARADLIDPFKAGFDLKAEYFNIGEGWTSTFGARREQDVLLTEGFLDGQIATLNIANEFQDFNEAYYESIIGWHGGTLQGLFSLGKNTEARLEYTLVTYNTNEQNRNTDTIFPDFLFTQGYTDTELFTFANTNDRGRDPRAVYQKFQNRLSQIAFVRIDQTFSTEKPTKGYFKGRFIWDRDERCTNVPLEDGTQPCPDPGADDYLGLITMGEIGLTHAPSDQLLLATGLKGDIWNEKGRSGELSPAGIADFDDYITKKVKFFGDLTYNFGGLTFKYHMEILGKDVDVSQNGVVDDAKSFQFSGIIRSVATLFVAF
jgi:hypothetical protein